MENISFFDIVESFFEQINPINHYEINNNIYQEKSLFEVIKSFFDNLYGYYLYDDE
jgi:hypothetical protein